MAVVPRYKPHLLAMRLDILSGGRVIFGVGMGDWSAPRAFKAFEEPKDPHTRAEILDEALEVITRLWSGEDVKHKGKHYVVNRFVLTAKPVQQPGIPIWVGGDAAMRRAARWDGWIGPDNDPFHTSPEDVSTVVGRLEKAGARPESFDIAWSGQTKLPKTRKGSTHLLIRQPDEASHTQASAVIDELLERPPSTW